MVWALDINCGALNIGSWTFIIAPWAFDNGLGAINLGPWALSLCPGPWALDLGLWILGFGHLTETSSVQKLNPFLDSVPVPSCSYTQTET